PASMQAAYLKPAVLRHHEVPGHFKEVFILSGYRPVSSVAQCVRSIFSWNNETLNVWSHLLGSLAFLSMAVGAVSEFGVSDPAVWPLYLFLLASVLYPLASALAHMFNVLSREARDVCFFIDYAAIAFYGHCATCAYSAYSLPGHMMAPASQLLLLAASTATAIWGVWTSCRTRFMPRSLSRQVLRLSGFVLACLIANLPVLARLAAAAANSDEASLPHWRRQLWLVLAMAFLYLTHLPERLWPGAFDIVGHSHQLFHLAGCMGTADQIAALRFDLRDRRPLLTSPPPWLPMLVSAGLVAACACGIVLRYSLRVRRLAAAGGGGGCGKKRSD
ncbi:hypothetical protein BOX15_Mlig011882g1, partial [Macrostomum lignano]|uniref:Progestin and adipoQ receptor family member IX n=2 Tax=Macrostomum lignano TaxID=282301 RepID=A0A1I8I7W1_9PLAT